MIKGWKQIEFIKKYGVGTWTKGKYEVQTYVIFSGNKISKYGVYIIDNKEMNRIHHRTYKSYNKAITFAKEFMKKH